MKLDQKILQELIQTPNCTRTIISEKYNISDSTARAYITVLENSHLLSNKIVNNSKSDKNRVLVIGDLHEPFTLDGYLEFCLSIKEKYQTNKTIFIGDIIDLHASSYHESNSDGYSAGEELNVAERKIVDWYSAFPEAMVCVGNHDLIPIRKAQTGGLSSRWIKDLSEVLKTPNWVYAEDFVIDNVLYTHGISRKAKFRAKNDMMSCVQGHYHSESYIEHLVGLSAHIWSMQVGCGIDRKSYAMAYGKHFNKPHINCGVVLENGSLPILEYMSL